MLFAATIIIVITVLYTIMNYSSKFSRIIALYFASLAGLMIISVIYTSKLSNYIYTWNVDYTIYLMLSKLRIHIYEISRLYNLCISVFMIAAVLLSTFYDGHFKRSKLLYIPIIYFFVINDPATCEWFYLKIGLSELENKQIWEYIIVLIHAINTGIVWIYMLMPIAIMLTTLKRAKLKIRRRYILISVSFVTLIDIFMYAVMIEGFWNNINYNNVDLSKFPVDAAVQQGYVLAPIFSLIILFFILFFTIYYKPYENLKRLRKREFAYNAMELNKNINMVLHTHKNAFLCAERIADIMLDDISNGNFESMKSDVLVLKAMVSEKNHTINRTLGLIREIKIKEQKISIVKCVDDALSRINIPKTIKVQKKVECTDAYIKGDEQHIIEAFVNIINNAINALQKKDSNNKVFDISISSEEEYLVVDFRDNGAGISNENISKIFHPFWSGDLSLHSSGIGLTYVKKVIKLHRGDIEAASEYGQYTIIKIIIPKNNSQGQGGIYSGW